MRLLLVLGVLGGVAWLVYAVAPRECLPPSSETEVFCNRLWTPALLAMALGFVGVWRGSTALGQPSASRGLRLVAIGAVAIMVGNFTEYWLFDTWPHQGANGWLRGVLWMTALAGLLLELVASVVTGVVLLRGAATRESRVLGAVLAIAPVTIIGVGVLVVGIVSIGASLASFALPPATATRPDAMPS